MTQEELRQALRDSSLLMEEELDNIMQVIEEHVKQEIDRVKKEFINNKL